MKISTVMFHPRGSAKKRHWEVSFWDQDGDRMGGQIKPNAWGFFHYPTKRGRKWAFEQLLAHMIKLHEEEIQNLQKSVDALKALEIPKKFLPKAIK